MTKSHIGREKRFTYYHDINKEKYYYYVYIDENSETKQGKLMTSRFEDFFADE